ncbi:DNA-binding protein [Halopelagius longus]|uniref:DNA-binding protein n=1 Tax=Halopelagius longus TaxID=1236180 RepID=A0A1H1GU50_9EURY|nr:DNA-binding protein [Halopelagius longus]RDI69563.1 DNA-binding protein [Halopelagius longus]SDR16700.1 ssDNA-binding replication factor A, large subunit [Halopelagius longus]
MSSKNVFGNEVSVDEQAFEQTDDEAAAAERYPVVDETPEFRPTVEQETQAKVDANHPDGIVDTDGDQIHGVTLGQEERIKAREAELERISAQAELGMQEGRAKRTRDIAAKQSAQRRAEFQKRAASVNPMADPEREDPRAELTQEQLAAVNTQADRLVEKLDGWSRAAIGRRLGEAVARGKDVSSAVVSVFEELQTAPGRVVPIGKLEAVDRKEVSIEGQVKTLWDPSHPSIAQVGLIADDSGQTRMTIWEASDAPWIEEGEQVRIHGAARNWYNGRVSVAVTGWSTIMFPERGRWWE